MIVTRVSNLISFQTQNSLIREKSKLIFFFATFEYGIVEYLQMHNNFYYIHFKLELTTHIDNFTIIYILLY